ncbi:MAG: YqgE/AlgH family protein [Rhodospirillales bacterium]|nr:YqgE/AlgH family protein [Rhodospirillales bacterium]MCB9997168.1 YqgE/AlgH family protein [Rhodospirillales bacterium]
MSPSEKNTSYLTGRLLLAMPAMGDPRFHKAVIYMCAHDANGAMGLVINHTLPGVDLGQLLEQLNIHPEEIKGDVSKPVMSGGPVETARGFVLHSNDFAQDDTIKIDEAFSVTGTIDALRAIASGTGPEKMLFILGYAGWGAGQLDQELQDNAWLVTDPDPDLIFGASAEEKWVKAVQTLGIDPGMLSGEAGNA